jgi:hypothetical protein
VITNPRLRDYVQHFPGAMLHGELLSKLVEYFERTSKQKMDMDWRSCEYVSFGDEEAVFEPTRQFMRDMFRRYRVAVENEASGALNYINRIETFNLFKYYAASGKDHFHGHADCWNSDSATRQLSLIAYLSNVEEGGETDFPTLGLKFKPQIGDVLVFPSNWLFYHKAYAPIVGDKLILVGWYHFGQTTIYHSYPL